MSNAADGAEPDVVTPAAAGLFDPSDPKLLALLTRCTFPPPGTEVSCAVSGGPDSTALLALACAVPLRVTAVHVDHALRSGSQDEAELVAELATRWGAQFRAERVPVDPGPDLESRARDARRSVLPSRTLYGHTADDQAETVLLRLIRGTGPSGLAAMRPATHPLLALRRAETEALCAHLGVHPVRDPMNDDRRFTRNRVRHEVLPLLDEVAARDVVPLLCRLAARSAAQADLLETLAGQLDPTDAHGLAAAPEVLATLALRAWWSDQTDCAHPPDGAAIARMLAVARGEAVGCDVLGGWQLRRSAGRLVLRRSGATPTGE